MPGKDKSKTDKAVIWLKDILSNGALLASDVLRSAKEMGYTGTTLHRAKKRLGIKPAKIGFDQGWWWELPKGPIQPEAESSDQKDTQVTDYVEDSTKVPSAEKMGCDGIFVDPRRFQGVEPSDKPFIGKGLSGVDPPKIPCSTVWGSSEPVGIFNEEDEVII